MANTVRLNKELKQHSFRSLTCKIMYQRPIENKKMNKSYKYKQKENGVQY